jgi:glycosyltransferase involved in cell wall biosynthesis
VRLTIVFMGKRGAGLRFLDIFRTYSQFYLNDVSFIVSRKASKNLSQIDSKTKSTFSISSTFDLFLLPLIVLHQFWTLVATTKLRKRHFLFVMPSPSDYFFILCLRVLRMPCSFIIHDPSTHSGEIWPTSRSIKFRTRIANKIYSLSKYTQEELKKNYATSSLLLDHPIFPISTRTDNFALVQGLKNYFLFIGRIRDYKGVLDLVHAFGSSKCKSVLVIAGEGDFQKPENEKILLINRWLSDAEIESLIAGSRAVIFPYRDASQSGVIPTCISFGVPMIVSDAGALAEQARAGQLIGIFEAGNIESLKEILIEAEIVTKNRSAKDDSDFQMAQDLSKRSSEKFVRELISSLL